MATRSREFAYRGGAMSDWDVVFDRAELEGNPVLVVSGEIDLAVAGRFAQELETLAAAAGAQMRMSFAVVACVLAAIIGAVLVCVAVQPAARTIDEHEPLPIGNS